MAMRALFDALGIACVISENNKEIMQRGAACAPEEICLPFKIMLGNFLSGIEQGADTVLITGSCGPCRFGEYGELFERMLKSAGHGADVLVIDAPSEIGLGALRERLGRIAGESRLPRTAKLAALRQAFRILAMADKLDAAAYRLTGYELHPGACSRLITACREKVRVLQDAQDALSVIKAHQAKLRRIDIDASKSPLRVAVVGEVFSMFEPYANLYIEERLMRAGVSTERLLTPSWWLKDLFFKPLHVNSPHVRMASKPFLPVNVGGHARETLAHAAAAKRAGMDGVIQIFPLGCMPEIVAKAVLPDIGLPVLTLVVDEMTGDAGYDTRIEAFLDMLEARRRRAALWA
jgi:predicted nucleotide-binding protein (sugar kinase/HSP70/actin superfamily)